jgi:hypothetical protein
MLAMVAAVPCIATAAEPIRVELNAATPAQGQCRLSFVIENKANDALTSLKLDLVLFDRDGVIARRLIAEMGPLRAAKTVVKTFEVEDACNALGAFLIKDVAGCAPDAANACLERLTPTSRVSDVKLFK